MLKIHRDEFPYFEWHRVVTTGIEHGAVVLTEPCFALPGVVSGRHFLAAEIAEMGDYLDRILGTSFGDGFSANVSHAAVTELPAAFDLRAELRALSFLHEVGFRGQP